MWLKNQAEKYRYTIVNMLYSKERCCEPMVKLSGAQRNTYLYQG